MTIRALDPEYTSALDGNAPFEGHKMPQAMKEKLFMVVDDLHRLASSQFKLLVAPILFTALAATLGAFLLSSLRSYISYHRKMSLFPAPNSDSAFRSFFSSKARDKFLSNAQELIRQGFSQVPKLHCYV